MKRKHSPGGDVDDGKLSKLLKSESPGLVKIDEKIIGLLNAVKLSSTKRTAIDKFISNLGNILTSDDIENEFMSSDLGRLRKMIPSFSCKHTFHFRKPLMVSDDGGFHLKTCLKMGLKVDVTVSMPKECLDPKDYLNQRYLYKRAMYTAYLASYLSKGKNKDFVENVKLVYEREIHVRPQLIIRQAEAFGKHFTICLYVKTEKDSFKWNRFHVNKNNLRPKDYLPNASDNSETDVYPATPHYNSWVLSDLTFEVHQQRLAKALDGKEVIKDVLILLKVWLHQRQLDLGFGGFSGFIMTSFIVHLLTTKKISDDSYSYQIFRNTLTELATSDWSKTGISMATDVDEQRPQLADFKSKFDVVFVDTSGYLNLCADMYEWTYECVRQEARHSIELMDAAGNGVDIFDCLWMTPMPFVRKYDEVFQVNFEGHMMRCAQPKKELSESIMDFCGNYMGAYLPRVVGPLKEALGEKIRLLVVRPTSSAYWSVDESPPLLDCSRMFGLMLEKEHCYESFLMGPCHVSDGISEEVRKFQLLWGEKAELRRFMGGARIHESVCWPSDSKADKRTIVKRIIRHIIIRHSSAVADDLTFHSNCLDRFLHLHPQLVKKSNLKYATGEEEHLHIILSLDALSKEIQSIDDLPLRIDSVRGISPVFCYAEVFPALPGAVESSCGIVGNQLNLMPFEPSPPFTPSMKVLCMLERSGKWPTDKDVCEKLKMSFLARLNESLKTKFGLMSVLHSDSLCVYKDGYVFRLIIGFTHEITLARMVNQPGTDTVKPVDSKEALALERLMVAQPRLTSMLLGVHGQYVTFGFVCRLAKRWLACHMLFDDFYMSEMALQIIVASLYVTSAPYQPPCSTVVGFLRFLHLMSTHDWMALPLIVNFNDELTAADCEEILTKFHKERSTLPAVFLSTPVDKFSQLFTRKCPTTHILTRIATLASESLSALQSQFDKPEKTFDLKGIFQPHSEVYDVIIRLKPDVCCRAHLAVNFGLETNLPQYSANPCQDKIPVYDHDLVLEFLHRLRSKFDDFGLFFYDVFGGKYIGVVWKPSAFQPRSISQTSYVVHRTLALSKNEELEIVPDVALILKEFEELIPGTVKAIETRRLLPSALQVASPV